MTLLAGGSLGHRWPGPGAPHPLVASHLQVDTRVPVGGYDQPGLDGQNGSRSSKKTKTGISTQPTMSWTR
jgi:hypothetical protein